MNKTRCAFAVGMLGIALLPLASTAQAQVSVTSPGLTCVEDNDVTPDIRYSFGNAFNSGGAAEIFNCPYTVYNPQGVAFSGRVTVNDASNTAGFSCAIRACNETGTSCNVSGTFTTTAGFVGITSSPFLTAGGFSSGYMYMRCTVPAVSAGNQSGIVSLRWLE